jgi:hypothetical protein
MAHTGIAVPAFGSLAMTIGGMTMESMSGRIKSRQSKNGGLTCQNGIR